MQQLRQAPAGIAGGLMGGLVGMSATDATGSLGTTATYVNAAQALSAN